jgi:8-oxo-dGTP pyrophosphatase MutT (NUDIX family)
MEPSAYNVEGMWERLVLSAEPAIEGDLPRAAVLAALYPDETGEVRVVLTKRPDTMPTHAGHLAFPGGRPHPDDDGPVTTALREAQEEVGIEPEDVEVLGFLPTIHTVEYTLMVVPVVGRLAQAPQLVPSPREVARVLTPKLSDLADENRWKFETWMERRVWFYELEGEILWGATAAMVRWMLGLPV